MATISDGRDFVKKVEKEYLYSPWRLDYILGDKATDCIFCSKPSADNDQKQLIVHRSEHCYVILNLYPYNNGHVMVIPYQHVSSLSGLENIVLVDLFATVRLTESILYNVYKCEGLNIGINQGKAAGAGIDEHIHVHLVPRWLGDANFMSTINNTRVIPEAFSAAWEKLAFAFAKATGEMRTKSPDYISDLTETGV